MVNGCFMCLQELGQVEATEPEEDGRSADRDLRAFGPVPRSDFSTPRHDAAAREAGDAGGVGAQIDCTLVTEGTTPGTCSSLGRPRLPKPLFPHVMTLPVSVRAII